MNENKIYVKIVPNRYGKAHMSNPWKTTYEINNLTRKISLIVLFVNKIKAQESPKTSRLRPLIFELKKARKVLIPVTKIQIKIIKIESRCFRAIKSDIMLISTNKYKRNFFCFCFFFILLNFEYLLKIF